MKINELLYNAQSANLRKLNKMLRNANVKDKHRFSYEAHR